MNNKSFNTPSYKNSQLGQALLIPLRIICFVFSFDIPTRLRRYQCESKATTTTFMKQSIKLMQYMQNENEIERDVLWFAETVLLLAQTEI
jgi:hypothetical protein